MSELEQARALAARLAADTEKGLHWAFLLDGNSAYFARGAVMPESPVSPIIRLIQGIYQLDPGQARRIVRKRIYASYDATAQCWGMLKVAARRLTAPFEPPVSASAEQMSFQLIDAAAAAESQPLPRWAAQDALRHWQKPTPPACDHDFLTLVSQLAKLVPREGPLYGCDREVAALLTSNDGAVLGWALNTNAVNRTRHAERNLLENWFNEHATGLPAGATLYVSLKPCRMCAGALWPHALSGKLRIVYGEHDPGPAARETVLDAFSPDRRRERLRYPAVSLEAQLERFEPPITG